MTNEALRLPIRRLVDGVKSAAVIGNMDVCCTDALPLRDAVPGCITLIDSPQRAAEAARSGAVAVVTAQPIESLACTQIVCTDIHAVFTHIVQQFRPRQTGPAYASIHSTAEIDPTAVIGDGTRIDARVVIGPGVVIGDNCHLMPGVVVMENAAIGNDCTLYANVVVYEHSRLENHIRVHSGAIIGAHGFGYRPIEGRHLGTAQLGYVHIESHVDIGANTTIDRGTYGVTRIGEGTKIDNLVMIAHNCHIGRHNLLCSQVGIAGSCKTGDYVTLAGQVGLADHITLGDHAIVGAQAGVMENLAEGRVYLGSPATSQRDQMQIMAVQRRLPELRREVKSLRREVDAIRSGQLETPSPPARREAGPRGPNAASGTPGPGGTPDPSSTAGTNGTGELAADELAPEPRQCIPFRRPAA